MKRISNELIDNAIRKKEEEIRANRKIIEQFKQEQYVHPNEGVKAPTERWKHSTKRYYQSSIGYYITALVLMIVAFILIFAIKTWITIIAGLGLLFFTFSRIPTLISMWQAYEEDPNVDKNHNDNEKIF